MLAAYLIRRADSPRVELAAARRGVFRWGGEYWNRFENNWVAANTPLDIFLPSERDTYALPTGGEWVEIYLDESLGAITN